MRPKIRSKLSSPCAATLLYWLTRFYCLTYTMRVENEKPWLEYLKNGGKVILCLWHQHIFLTINHLERYRPYRPGIMISRSQDGEIIAGILKKCGWFPVRGSSSRGGVQAFKMLIEQLKETGLVAHVLDGPQGPKGKVKNGAIHLAHAAEAIIVPVHISVNRAWHLNSWDNFILPKPFSRVDVFFGDMIKFDSDNNQDELERQRQYLENLLLPCLT